MKKILAMALVVAMLLSVAAMAETTFNETGLPIVNEPVTVKMACSRAANWGDPNEGGFWKALEEKTGVHVEFDCYVDAEANEKYNLMMAGGTYPEAFIGGLGGSDTNLMTYGPLGVYLALNDLIDQYGENLKRAVEEEDPMLLELCRMLDGNIYSVPAYIDAVECNYPNMLCYNKDFLAMSGMDVPTTTDELYDFLVFIRDNDCNGNGDPTDEIPLTFDFGSWDGYLPVSLFGAFGYPYLSGYTLVDNGKVVFTATSDGYKEAVKWLNKLWTEGLIDLNAFSMADQGAAQAGDVPVLGVNMGWDRTAWGSTKWKDSYDYMLPIYGPDGQASSLYYDYNYFTRSRFVITDKAENPALLMRWVDQFYADYKTGVEAIMGHVTDNEDEPTYALEKDGKIYVGYWDNSYTEELGHTDEENELRKHAYDRGWYNLAFCPTILGKAASSVVVKDPGKQEKDEIAQLYAAQEGNKFASGDWHSYPPVLMTEAETEEYSLLNTDITTFAKENLAAFIVGDQDIESGWDAYVQQLEGMGLDRWLEIKQDAYDRFING